MIVGSLVNGQKWMEEVVVRPLPKSKPLHVIRVSPVSLPFVVVNNLNIAFLVACIQIINKIW